MHLLLTNEPSSPSVAAHNLLWSNLRGEGDFDPPTGGILSNEIVLVAWSSKYQLGPASQSCFTSKIRASWSQPLLLLHRISDTAWEVGNRAAWKTSTFLSTHSWTAASDLDLVRAVRSP